MKSHRDAMIFEKLVFKMFFRPYQNAKLVFSNSFGLKSVLKKLRFRDGLAGTVGLTDKEK